MTGLLESATKVLDAVESNPCGFIGFLVLLIIVFEGLRDVVAAARGPRDKRD